VAQWQRVHADDTALANKKLIAFYFSAPLVCACRKFTPELVDYYNRVAAQHPEFEIVFYSFDKSPFAFETYIREANMPRRRSITQKKARGDRKERRATGFRL